MNVYRCEETQIWKSSCQLGILIRKVFKYWPGSITRDSNSLMSQKKKSYKPRHTESTNRSQMLWRSNSAPSHWMHYNEESASQQLQITHYKWMLTGTLQYAEKREPLAKSINSCNSILCLRAHKGSHKHCQIILHGPILYFSSICAADIQEFCSCLAMTQLIPTYEGHGPHRLLPRDLKLMNGDTTLLWD